VVEGAAAHAAQWCGTLPELIEVWHTPDEAATTEAASHAASHASAAASNTSGNGQASAPFRGLESLSVPGLFSVSLLIQRGLWLQSQYDNLLMMLPPQFENELKYELFEIVTIAEVRKADDGAVINGDERPSSSSSGSSSGMAAARKQLVVDLHERTRARASLFALMTLRLLPPPMQTCFATRSQPAALFTDLLAAKLAEAGEVWSGCVCESHKRYRCQYIFLKF
jgi:hypothetical protein